MSADAGTLIHVEELSKRYRSGNDDLVIFSGLTFDVMRGERLAIIGESGAGKSTLLYLLGALDRPSGGTIHFNQRDISRLSDSGLAELRNREVGFVWQNHSLLPEFTALENVMMPLLIRGATYAESSPISLARLDEVGLRNRASHRAGELSGGEQQRVALARALVGDPKVLLADEPTGSLDFRTGDMIMTLLEELHRTHDLTSIYVTHNLEFAQRGDRILKLEKGKLHMSAALSDPALSKNDGEQEKAAHINEAQSSQSASDALNAYRAASAATNDQFQLRRKNPLYVSSEAHRPAVATAAVGQTRWNWSRLTSPLCASFLKAQRSPSAATNKEATRRTWPPRVSPFCASFFKEGKHYV